MNGVLIIDKPSGLTSHDVVNRVRGLLNQRSVGHLGTLDPSATGVLPIVIGSYTRLAQFYATAEKSYEGVIRFGFATDTYDAEGESTTAEQFVTVDVEQIAKLAAQFRGVIKQMPPPFSAKKIHGVPAYKLARRQKEVVLKPVCVEIKEFEITEATGNCAHFRACVASGTYIRSVAHDMGIKFGCGAHLQSLRRTSVGEFSIADAKTLEQIAERTAAINIKDEIRERGSAGQWDERSPVNPDLFFHPRMLLPHMPCVTADEPTALRVRNGRPVNLPNLSQSRQVKVFAGQRDLIAIATRVAGSLFHPKIVLCAGEDRTADARSGNFNARTTTTT